MTNPSENQVANRARGRYWLAGIVAGVALGAGAWTVPCSAVASSAQANTPAETTPSEAAPAQNTEPIGRTAATEVKVAGAVNLHQGELLLGNGSTITAGTQPVKIALSRGGEILLCSTTSLHLSRDDSIPAPRSGAESTALMMALDRGALEAHYEVGKYSDVVLTPDLRILISGPGEANLSIHLNAGGDTCVDNHGANAPYVTVSSQLDGGAYRVQPNQRVTFEHGGLQEVVDAEKEPCGCPPPLSVAESGTSSVTAAHPGERAAAASSNPFPLAESEGLAPPPAPPATPVVPVGTPDTEVTVPLTYDGQNPPAAPPPVRSSAKSTPPATAEAPPSPGKSGLFHRIGHFFSHIFG